MATSMLLPLDIIVDLLIRLTSEESATIQVRSEVIPFVGEIDCHRYVKPVAYSRSGDKVLVSPVGDGFCWYDLERHRDESIVEVDYQGIDFWRQGSGREQVTIIARGILSTPSLLKRSGLKNQNIGISREPDGRDMGCRATVFGRYKCCSSCIRCESYGHRPGYCYCTAQSVLEVLKGKEE
ncbi:hypothetical protein CUMW_096270 [Citrus unshiu]|uniref:Uncharacterized protein n=1 Tax=Citrus unshiu TaxID=55188 RepID=A0A2H5P1T7_CITUN|nr:hypothetical protein CUMW_096270 [Citrus unshiu]